jgi:hypothetical protein
MVPSVVEESELQAGIASVANSRIEILFMGLL